MPILNYGPRLKEFAYRPIALDRRINILEGSVRSGKTWALHPKILQACRYPIAGWRVLTGVSKQTIFNNVLNDLFNIVGPSNYTYNHQSGLLSLCGSNWLVMGAKDEGSEKYVRGLTVGIALGDEISLMPQEFFQMLLTRMSPDGARMYGTTNPSTPHHWLKTEFLDNPNLRSSGILWSGHYTMEDNPNLSPEFIEAQKRMYTGVFYQRYILGQWVTAESSIYRDVLGPQCKYDDSSRPIALLTSPAERYVFVDYGTVNPCVFLDVYGDGKTLYQEREYYWDSEKERRQKTDAEYGEDFNKFVGNDRRGLVVIVDPSAASFKLELVRRGYQVKNGDNEVLEGIRRVSSALKMGMYKIHERNCPMTLKEHEGYAWDDKKADKGKEEPIKDHDHACFVARTMIDAPGGCIPIEHLTAGSIISTPLGNCKVLKIGDRIAPCIDNGILTGTAEHPIYMNNKWTRLDAMRYNVLCESNLSPSTESNFGAIQTLSASPTGAIIARTRGIFAQVFRRFMSRYGRAYMGLFHRSITSTTLTSIQGTMTLPTLDVCRGKSTYRSTGKAMLPILSTWQQFARLLKNGTPLRKAQNGIENTLFSYGNEREIAGKSLSPVRNVGSYSKHGESQRPFIAPTLANAERVVNQAWTISPRFARFVASSLWRTRQMKRFVVAGSVVRDCGKQTVYALTTEHGCYIANGVLVSNCDAVRVGICRAIPKWRLG